MKRNLLLPLLLFIIGSFLIVFALFWDSDEDIQIKSFVFEKENLEMVINERFLIPINVEPLSLKEEIIYSGYDNNIVEIDNNGFIKAVKLGTTQVDAKLKDKKITMIVKVLDKNKLYFNENEITIGEKEKYQLNVLANFDLDKTSLKYKVIDESILKISKNGEILPLKAGTTNIIVSYNELSATIKVTISSNYYKIIYDYQGVKKNEESICDIDKDTKKCELSLPVIDVADEYKVIGWSFEKEGKGKIYKTNEKIEVDSDKIIYAIISKYKNKFEIKYNLNGATSVSKNNDVCYTDDNFCEVSLPKIVRNGEKVEVYGWSNNVNDITAKYKVDENIKITKNETLYAISSITYEAKFYKNSIKDLVKNQSGTWKEKSDYISTSCKAYNSEKKCTVYTPLEIITNNEYEVPLGFSENKNSTTKSIGVNEKISLNKLITSYYPIIKTDTSLKLIPLSDYKFPNVTPVTQKKTLKVLIIDIDPILSKGSVSGRNCAGITASECLGFNKQQAINELIDDMWYSSHGIVDVKIVKTDKINEFSTHKNTVTLLNNTKAHRLDEDTWLDMMKNGWYAMWSDSRVKEMGDYSLDYEYLINKLNLIQRRNNGEFNEVWLVNVDPTKSYESLMVGRSSYWINGPAINKSCENFRIMNVSISRPDVNFECFGHASENIMNNVFQKSLTYAENKLNISSSNYSSLTLWEKFTLTEHNNQVKGTGLVGVGNVHFSPNSTTDYEWENYNKSVKSKWREWLNYPNLTNNASNEIFNPNSYMSVSLAGTNSAARKHHRWWFNLMPHVSGYTNDGYSNNWWDYLYLSDFVTKVTASKKNYTYSVGDYVNIELTLTYKSLKSETIKLDKYNNNMIFSNKNLFSVDGNGKVVASSKGNSTLKYYRDGKYETVNITIQ